MNDWSNVAWFQQDWVFPFLFSFLTVALIGAVIWFVDGMRKYGYWMNDEEETEDKEDGDMY